MILMEEGCKFCKEGVEDVGHALYYYPSLKECWTKQLNCLPPKEYKEDSVEVARKVMSKGSKEDMEKFFLIAWGLWHRRNQKVHEEKVLQLEQVVEHALSLQKDYNEVQGKSKKLDQMQCRWNPPPPGVMKLNVDGAIFHDQHKTGVGIILQDEQGEVLMFASKKEHEVKDPTKIELLAIFWGLQLCSPLGLHELIIESDSLLMVKELQNAKDTLSLLGNLIEEIKGLMKKF